MESRKRTTVWYINAAWISLLLLLAACGGNTNLKGADTPTAGRIQVGVDDSYHLLVEAELYTFEAMYKYASIDTIFGTEADDQRFYE
jgi:hypothetical protein